MVLHNLTRMQNGDEGWLNRQTSNICPEHFVDLPGGDNHYNNDVMSLSSQIEDGNTVRDMIALNMWNDYSLIMFGRGSPRINLMKAAAVQRKPSPKISSTQKRKPSPKVDHSRASWDAGLEKALIDLLHEHNNECYRGQNGWSTEAWNKIVKLFHEKFPYVRFTKSHPKAKRFRNKSFPLFESLGELYDGQTAEGTLNFTSIAPSQVPVTQPYQGGATTQPSQSDITQANYIGEETEKGPFDPSGHAMDDDDEVRIVDQPTTSSSLNKREKRPATSRNKNPVSSDKAERAGFKRRQDGKVVEMMGWFLELKEKQAEAEPVQQKRARTNAHEFPIQVCIAVVDNMEDLSDDEKVEASDVFKDPQNRVIFMTAKDSNTTQVVKEED
ncbi:unnamed protein product [Miscanthus lutarioriparius]|uniref:Myb/SANT-like domain-containing protein n=1 Tax=Miscanthus lutarioriparius TaxID=422564 RepID=A0A811SLI0_9POAL|nr:unnamed protein product [Miscanthus lutarioriparius]